MDNKDMAKYLDYTNLTHQTTRREIKFMVDNAIKYEVGGLCIHPCWVYYVTNRLKAKGVTSIKVITVPNWVMGGGLLQLDGIADSCFEECDEIDYIWNAYEFGDLKLWDKTKEELEIVRKKTKGKLKIIIEAYYLRVCDDKIYKQGMESVIRNACKLVNESGADWIKTDSGLFKRPDFESLLEDATLMVKHSSIPVKAAGGITTRFHAEKLIEAGVQRIGASDAIRIIKSNVNV